MKFNLTCVGINVAREAAVEVENIGKLCGTLILRNRPFMYVGYDLSSDMYGRAILRKFLVGMRQMLLLKQ